MPETTNTATVLSAMHFEQSLGDVVASTLVNHIKVVNSGVIPRSLDMCTDDMDLVKSARWHKWKIEDLLWLLDSNGDECTWKQQAHNYAKKIIIKFICQGKLDEDSMASLLRLPQTTTVACKALVVLESCHWLDFYCHDIYFSSTYNQIVPTLLALLHNNGISIKERRTVMESLLHFLEFESEDTIFKVAEKYKAFLAMDSNPNFQAALIGVLSEAWGRGVCTLAEFPGVLEDLMALLLFGKDHEVRLSAAQAIRHLSGSRRISLRIAVFPNALQMLFDSFISDDIFESGEILSRLSIVPENRIKFGEIQGIWEGLGSILAKLEGAWRELRDKHFYRWKLERRASIAATIFGYLGLEKDFREGLMFLQLTEMAGDRVSFMRPYYCSTQALTILYSNPAEQRSTSLPPLEDVVEILAAGGIPQSKSTAMASAYRDIYSFMIYWTRVLAYLQMGSYQDSLSNLNLAHHHLDLIAGHHFWSLVISLGHLDALNSDATSLLRECRVFLQVMQEDYVGALSSASSGENPLDLGQTGVLKWRSGDLQGALEDLEAAEFQVNSLLHRSDLFKHRGYVKFLMGDEIGARKDGETARKLKLKEDDLHEFA